MDWFQIPLKQGEKHCPHCLGYGVIPITYNQSQSIFKPPKCLDCMGVAKYKSKRT